MQAILLKKIGDSSVLVPEKSDNPKPKSTEVVLHHTAIGINFFDVCFRRGQYNLPSLPSPLGLEACGIIESVGSDVTDFKAGDRVAYGTGPLGSYTKRRAIDQRYLVVPPQGLTDVQVAGSLTKGLMAHTLLFRVFLASRSKKILVHAAAGGVGQFLCQWAKHLGIEVIGTVGDDAKTSQAMANGCSHVINYKKSDLIDEVARITADGGVGVVYDGVGKDVIDKSLACLWPMGMYVSFGESSGTPEKLDLNSLVTNSLYITRPSLAMYKANRIELVLSANEVFAGLEKGILRPKITTYDFSEIAKAHHDLESRSSMGSLVLTLSH